MPTWLKHFKLNKSLILILLLASALRLVNLGNPPEYIFDEVYHSFTAREYLHGHTEAWEWWTTPPPGVAYEWTHPPVAKYGMMGGMWLFGENSFGWRFGSAAFGILSILGLYFLVLAVTGNKLTSLISAFLVSIEGLHISQSRVGMNDVYMLCFLIWSLYLAVKSRWKLSALLFGLSLASKWSALYGIVPLSYIYLHGNKITLSSLFLALRLLLITIFVYVLTFTPFIMAGHTWAQWWELQRQMWYYHTHLVATHGYQSTPLQWLFDVRPVWYYVKYLEDKIANIYALGNPLILWLGLVAFILQVKKLRQFAYFLFSFSYLLFTLPWVFSPRIMFFYHYLPSSVFLSIILASWLSNLTMRTRSIILLLCLIGLFLISPFLYGFPISKIYWDGVFALFPTWR